MKHEGRQYVLMRLAVWADSSAQHFPFGQSAVSSHEITSFSQSAALGLHSACAPSVQHTLGSVHDDAPHTI